jgi:hypothetical protein
MPDMTLELQISLETPFAEYESRINDYTMGMIKRCSAYGDANQPEYSIGFTTNVQPSEYEQVGRLAEFILAHFPAEDLRYAGLGIPLRLPSPGSAGSIKAPPSLYVTMRVKTVCSERRRGGFVGDNQYGVATVQEDDGGLSVLVVSHMPITQNVICSVSALMRCLAAIFDVEYDGWGSTIQRSA